MLVGNVADDDIHLFGVDGECSVAILPVEVFQGIILGLDPLGGIGFDLFYQIHERDFFGQQAQDVDVVGVAANDDGLAAQLVADAPQVAVQLLLIGRVDQVLAVLRAEDDVDVVFDE